MTEISGLQTDEERALYNTKDAVVKDCFFEGEADGESALKECADISVENCRFKLRYPMWHDTDFSLSNSVIEDTSRAPLWYDKNGTISNCDILGIKALRECRNINISNCNISSGEFGWKCADVSINECDITSEYPFFNTDNLNMANSKLNGKYSFQYTENVSVKESVLKTKDAFWHSENAVVTDSVIEGEYLGWYSDGLTLINCKLIGTQPLCYCKNLKLINCTMENADLAFEYSEGEIEIVGDILSVKNFMAGKITVSEGSIGEIINDNQVYECKGEIVCQ